MMEAEVLWELPRGRHRLPRAVVAASQRRRLLVAMADQVAEQGYARTTAAAVYGRAGVSSKAFYDHFIDKEDCFLAAYDQGVSDFLAAVTPTPKPTQAHALDSLAVLLDRYLIVMARRSSFARAFLIEVYGAGPRALERRLEVHQRFVDAVYDLLSPAAVKADEEAQRRFAVDALVSAITFMVTTQVAAGHFDRLPNLAPRLMSLVGGLCPWVSRPPVTGPDL